MKNRKITIIVSGAELNALEDSLLTWTLCKKHKAETFDLKTGRSKTEQEIFKMRDECEDCQKERDKLFKKAWKVTCKMFDAYLQLERRA